MNGLSKEDLKRLGEHKGLCVSLFMPTHRVATQNDPIRFRKMLGEAEDLLVQKGMRSPEAKALLAPARGLLEDNPFWQHQSDGLALYAAQDAFSHYRVPRTFEQSIYIDDHFYTKPLYPLFNLTGAFYILTLTQKKIRMFECTRYRIAELSLDEVPKSLAEALTADVPEKELYLHTLTGGGEKQDRGIGVFHGHGFGVDEPKDKVLRFFQRIDRAIHDYLRGKNSLLVLAGVEYILPRYREANTYSFLVEQGITGNPELIEQGELHARALQIVEPYFEEPLKDAARKYEQLAGERSIRASHKLDDIVPAAFDGRIETLFFSERFEQWGQFERVTHRVRLHDRPEPGDHDLVDLSALQTLLNDGDVFAVPPEHVPGGAQVAAVFRY